MFEIHTHILLIGGIWDGRYILDTFKHNEFFVPIPERIQPYYKRICWNIFKNKKQKYVRRKIYIANHLYNVLVEESLTIDQCMHKLLSGYIKKKTSGE